MAETVVVKESFIGNAKGTDEFFVAGELVNADHPAVKKWPQFFRAPTHMHGVEQATAAPGEKRK